MGGENFEKIQEDRWPPGDDHFQETKNFEDVSTKSQKSADNGGYANPSTRFYTPPICEILTLGDGDTMLVGNEQFCRKSYVDDANGPISETPEEDSIEGQQMIVESKAKTPAKDAKLTVKS